MHGQNSENIAIKMSNLQFGVSDQRLDDDIIQRWQSSILPLFQSEEKIHFKQYLK